MNKTKFERHFAGRSNAGLRARIRASVGGHRCGPSNAASVIALGGTVALTAAGHHLLLAVADDYRAVGSARASCDCDACCAGNLQRLGAA